MLPEPEEPADVRLNMEAIPPDMYLNTLSLAFEGLRPGDVLRVVDGLKPDWVLQHLENRHGCTLRPDQYRIQEESEQFVVTLRKPGLDGFDVEDSLK